LVIGVESTPSAAPSKVVEPIASRIMATDPGESIHRVAAVSQRRVPRARSRTSSADSEANIPK
jgi:hypothetical protein